MILEELTPGAAPEWHVSVDSPRSAREALSQGEPDQAA